MGAISELRHARLKALHARCLACAERYPWLRHAALPFLRIPDAVASFPSVVQGAPTHYKLLPSADAVTMFWDACWAGRAYAAFAVGQKDDDRIAWSDRISAIVVDDGLSDDEMLWGRFCIVADGAKEVGASNAYIEALRALDEIAEHAMEALSLSRPSFSTYRGREQSEYINRWIEHVYRLVPCNIADKDGAKLQGFYLPTDVFTASATAIEYAVENPSADYLPITEETTNPDKRWLTVSEAASISAANSGAITRAADQGKLATNGKRGRERRICAVGLANWQIERARKPEAQESDAEVQRKLRRLGG